MVQVLKHDWFVRFRKSGKGKETFYQVKFREISEFETTTDKGEFSEVANGANSGNIQIENLEPNDNQLFFCIPGIKDGCKYIIKLPSNIERWGVPKDTDIGRVDNQKSPYFKPNPRFGFWLPPEQYPAFVAYNDVGEAVTPKLYFEIIKYEIEKIVETDLLRRLEEGSVAYTQLEIGGINR